MMQQDVLIAELALECPVPLSIFWKLSASDGQSGFGSVNFVRGLFSELFEIG
jgi:hypothetical protein